MDRVDGERFYKIRGAKKNTNRYNHPKFQLMDSILALEDTFPKYLKYIFRCILKVGKFKVIQKSKGYDKYQDKQPGDDYIEKRTAQFNNTHLPVDTIEEYEKRDKRSKIKDKVLFEKYAAKGIEYVHGMMILDKLLGRVIK